MRSIVLAVCLFIFAPLASAQEARPISDAEQFAVTSAVEDFLYGASVNDVQAHDVFWAPELTYTSSSGVRFGKSQLMEGMTDTTMIPEDEVTAWYTAEDIELKAFGPSIIINFTLVSTDVATGNRETFLNTGVMVERRGQWQAVNWNATRTATPQSAD
ncbi:nuclear transport factor 2 family protein [Pseudidiomarina homiensis]|uniref:nuclear transport factor 2 family protein n=1 Tax=Pseudidiomarina homiensis TaxID=364198 RepID=UPI00215A8CBB|nr:nuclear transport factor 2 family protein [Pseudidiomarina homiensis]